VKIHKTLGARFAANLKKIRAERELSQEKFAPLIGVSRTYVLLLEQGARTPSLEMVDQIASKLGKNPVDLLK
jgi:transcriptional regulator with XRE-family HTH domain